VFWPNVRIVVPVDVAMVFRLPYYPPDVTRATKPIQLGGLKVNEYTTSRMKATDIRERQRRDIDDAS